MHIQPMSNTENFKGLSLKSATKPLKIAAVALPLALGATACQQKDTFNHEEYNADKVAVTHAIKDAISKSESQNDTIAVKHLEKLDSAFTNYTERYEKIQEDNKKTENKISVGKMILYIATILFLLKLAMKEDEE